MASTRGKIPSAFPDQVVYLMARSGFMVPQLGAVMSFEGRLDAARLERAFQALAVAEPVLASRFVPDDRRPYWQPRDMEGVRIVRMAEGEADDAIAVLAEPLDPEAAPQLRATLLRGVRGDTLALTVGHVAMDGRGVVELLGMLADRYRRGVGPEQEPNAASERDIAKLVKGGGLLARIKALRPEDMFPPSGWGFPKLGSGRESARILRRVGPERYAEIREYAHSRGATMTELLLTAYYRALFEVLATRHGEWRCLQCMWDLRDEIASRHALGLGNLSAVWNLRFECRDDEPFAGTMARLMSRTEAWRKYEPALHTALGTKLADSLGAIGGFKLMSAQISDLLRGLGDHGMPVMIDMGAIPEAAAEFGPEVHARDAYVLGPQAFPPGFSLSASVFRDTLTLATGFPPDALDSKIAVRVMDAMVAELPGEACVTTVGSLAG